MNAVYRTNSQVKQQTARLIIITSIELCTSTELYIKRKSELYEVAPG
jgi:hypothetical protein